jgi:hypothetical protein
MLGLLQLRPPIRPLTLPAVSRSIVKTLLLGANANRAPVARYHVILRRIITAWCLISNLEHTIACYAKQTDNERGRPILSNCLEIALLTSTFAVHSSQRDHTTQLSFEANGFYWRTEVGLASDAIEIVVSLRWLHIENRKEDRIYLRTDEANPDTIESAHVLETNARNKPKVQRALMPEAPINSDPMR